ncbi:Hypothetical predicted protein, partial [Paramuricea clavata]
EELTGVEAAAIEPLNEPTLLADDDRTQWCSCKSTCSKRSGRKKRGCPCRDEGVKCTQKCSFGTKTPKGKSKPQGQGTAAFASAEENAFERHQIAVNEAKQQITEFITTLTVDQKDKDYLNF